MLTKAVAEMTSSLAYILDFAFVALYHIDEIGRRARDVMSYAKDTSCTYFCDNGKLPKQWGRGGGLACGVWP